MEDGLGRRVRELWDEAQGGALPGVLRQQGTDGLWKTTRGQFEPVSGSVREWSDEVANIGLHTFVTERLLADWIHIASARAAAMKGLGAIVSNAVYVDEQWLWRWLKVPTQPDYLYPPDYDDSARAVATLRLGEQVLTRNEFSEAVAKNGKCCQGLDLARLAVRDLCSLNAELQPINGKGGSLRAAFIFVGGLAAKSNNTVDPVVNANLLYALAMAGKGKQGTPAKVLLREVAKYLHEVAGRWTTLFSRFPDFSRCYLSPCFFAYLCAHIGRVAPELIGPKILHELAEGTIHYMLEQPRAAEDAAWALVVLATAGICDRKLTNRLAERIVEGLDPILGVCEPLPIYQHKRLGHVFSSRACSTLFCLEGLRTYLSMVSTQFKRNIPVGAGFVVSPRSVKRFAPYIPRKS